MGGRQENTQDLYLHVSPRAGKEPASEDGPQDLQRSCSLSSAVLTPTHMHMHTRTCTRTNGDTAAASPARTSAACTSPSAPKSRLLSHWRLPLLLQQVGPHAPTGGSADAEQAQVCLLERSHATCQFYPTFYSNRTPFLKPEGRRFGTLQRTSNLQAESPRSSF